MDNNCRDIWIIMDHHLHGDLMGTGSQPLTHHETRGEMW